MSDVQRQHKQERLSGCVHAFEEAGITEYQRFLVVIEDEDDIYRKTVEMIHREDWPTAVFFNDYMALSVYRGIWDCGLKIPNMYPS